MAITWTDDTICVEEHSIPGNDALDAQSIQTHDSFARQSRSAGELPSQCYRNAKDLPNEITFSWMQALKRENVELKSKLNCFICRQKLFTHVLIPCSHVVCGNCVKLTFCCCSLRVETSHPCTLPSISQNTEQETSFSSSVTSSGAFSSDSNTS